MINGRRGPVGAGCVFGNAHTHDRLVRELAVGANAAVVFLEYDLSPKSRYPVAIEQSYAVARWVVVADGARPTGWTPAVSLSPVTPWSATCPPL